MLICWLIELHKKKDAINVTKIFPIQCIASTFKLSLILSLDLIKSSKKNYIVPPNIPSIKPTRIYIKLETGVNIANLGATNPLAKPTIEAFQIYPIYNYHPKIPQGATEISLTKIVIPAFVPVDKVKTS